jgi:hypothetical protein
MYSRSETLVDGLRITSLGHAGSPETVARKIAANLTTLGAARFDLRHAMGGLSHQAFMTNVELYGTRVIPRVRELLAGESGAGPLALQCVLRRPDDAHDERR